MRARYWTPERIKLLKKIHATAEKYAKGSILNWEYAVQEYSSDIKKILGPDIDTHFLSKSWSKYSKVLNGYCYGAGCTNKRLDGRIYCASCAKKNQHYVENCDMARILSKGRYMSYAKLIDETLREKSKNELIEMIIENFGSFSKEFRKNFFPQKVQEEIKSKNLKKFKR